MTYELAKQLKEAGFPQQEYDFDPPGFHFRDPAVSEEYVYHPTLSELIEACGDKFTNLALVRQQHVGNLQYKDRGRLWVCSWITNGVNDLEDTWEFEGSTPEEAVAKLYIALHNG